MKNIKEQSEDSGLQALELKANLNPEQRAYLDVLKDKMRKILGGKTKQELAKAGDIAALKKYRAILTEISEFLKTKNIMARQIKNENLNDAERKQLEIISIAMKKNENNPDDAAREEMLKRLNEQWDLIENRSWPSIDKLNSPFEIFKSDILFPVAELKKIVARCDDDIFGDHSSEDSFLFTKQTLDKNDNILMAYFEKIGDPEKKYRMFYKSTGRFGKKLNTIQVFKKEWKNWRDYIEYDNRQDQEKWLWYMS